MPHPQHSATNTEAEPATPDDETAQLRQCIDDLISVQSLPALWRGHKPSRVVGRLLKLAVRMLHLEFAYARLADSNGGVDIEAIRCAHRRHQQIDPRIVRKPLEPWLSGNPTPFSSVIANPLGEGTLLIAATPFGPHTGTGILVAAATRGAFPTEVETLLLSVAASKATIVVHEARLVDSRRRTAAELARRVAERTRELTAANDALRKEVVERKRAEDALGISREALAHATRVTSMGELIASIAHEVNQPLAAIVTNGYASLRWLQAKPRNLAEAHAAVTRVIADASRASEVISAIRAFLSRGDSHPTRFQIQEIIGDVMVLLRDQALRCGVSLRDNSAIDVPAVIANRVQIKQVILNLAMNAIEAMCAISGRSRDLAMGVQRQSPHAILVSVRDSGIGLDSQHRERIFEAFFTTKPEGIGMGLAISRSIVDAHGGRLWSTPNNGFGETFQFTLPVADAGRA